MCECSRLWGSIHRNLLFYSRTSSRLIFVSLFHTQCEKAFICLMLNYWYMSEKRLYTCSLAGIRICNYVFAFINANLFFVFDEGQRWGEMSLYLQGQLVWVPLSSDRWPPLLPVWVWRSKKMAGQQMWLTPESPLPEIWRKTRQTLSWSFKIIHLT